jgi:hypothetical protein
MIKKPNEPEDHGPIKLSKTFYAFIMLIVLPITVFLSEYNFVLYNRFYGDLKKVRVIEKSQKGDRRYQLHVSMLENPAEILSVEVSDLGYYMIKKDSEIGIYLSKDYSLRTLRMLMGTPEEMVFIFIFSLIWPFLNGMESVVKSRDKTWF